MPFKVGPEMDLPEGFLDARQLRAHELGHIIGGKANYGPGLELTHFRDPQTGSTLAFREGEPITTETVKAKLQESRAAFNKGNEPR